MLTFRLISSDFTFTLTKTNNKSGILLFFPSYKYLETCYNVWQKCKIIQKIKKYKSIILDSSNNSPTDSTYLQFVTTTFNNAAVF